MSLILSIIVFLVSMTVLIKASDWFVNGAETIGLSLGVSPFVIGVTLVAFGTSLPELAASIAAVLVGSSEIVVGNVVGSNVTNILLVIGLSAVIGNEITIDRMASANKLIMLIASALLMFFTLRDGELDKIEAIIYLAGMFFFLMGTIQRQGELDVERPTAYGIHYLMLAGGAALVYAGAHFTIVSIGGISSAIGVSSEIIALTGVALGTSLPEVVVSVTAMRKGKSDIAIGNVLGSNIFNSFAVMGIPGLISNLRIPKGIIDFSLPMMVGVTMIFAFMFTESRINKWEGWTLMVVYIFFVYASIFPQPAI
jgi:cation:H+ antiporter